MITTITSLMGGSAHFKNLTAQGKWIPEEVILQINILEFRVVHYVCMHFLPHVKGYLSRIMLNNRAAIVKE